jgi:hypothetical protein
MQQKLPLLVYASFGFLLLSGSVALLMPVTWSTLFGLQTDDAQALAFARVAGAREVVLVLIAIVLLKRGLPGVAAVTCGLSILIGVADFTIVYALRGTAAAANLVVHASGIVLLAATLLRLRASTA